MNLSRRLPTGLLLAAVTLASARAADVDAIAPDQAVDLVARQKGLLVMSLSSTDPGCGPCVGHNARFLVAAQGKRDFARYVQVTWQPWAQIPPAIQPLMHQYGITGVPAMLVFRDGQLENKHVGQIERPVPAPPAPESGQVPQVLARDAAATLAASRGTVVVMLSSFETTCAFCLRANPGFEELARTTPGVRFLRVMYRPWTWAASEDFGKSVEAAGLPVYLTYRDGKQVRRHMGIADVGELRGLLVDGLD